MRLTEKWTVNCEKGTVDIDFKKSPERFQNDVGGGNILHIIVITKLSQKIYNVREQKISWTTNPTYNP